MTRPAGSLSRRVSAILLMFVLAGCATGSGGSSSRAPAQRTSGADAEGARSRRPLPPLPFLQAIENGTRTSTGEPGPRYWQQWVEYDLTAAVFPDDKRLEGTAEIRYVNRSPDTLEALAVQLIQNTHAAGVVRNQPEEITGGVVLRRVAVNGTQLDSLPASGPPPETDPRPFYQVQGTLLAVAPSTPVPPGGSVELAFEWEFEIPQQGASGRLGWSRDDLLHLAYWYPQLAVYDDVVGWHLDPFLGSGEFYADFADYDVRIDAPAGWVVMATGALQNPEQTLSAPVRERLALAEASDEVVHVLAAPNFAGATLPGRDGRLTWHFVADSVRDFAFSATRESAWDAARSAVGDRDGDGDEDYARVDAFYRELAPRWAQVARYAQHSVEFLSEWTGLSYPWPHMSVIEASGIIGGGMEFPMLTIIGDYNAAGDSALYNVTVHEIAHMWVPMTVGNDERRYGWLDEGTTTFNENQARKDFFPGSDPEAGDWEQYRHTVLSGLEGEILRWSDYHYNPLAFTVASYAKPGLMLTALRGLLGEETFVRAFREFMDRWAWKHPYPWDLFHTFESVSGRELDWFWRNWYEELGVLDQAVSSVTPSPEGTRIVVEDRGEVPMPTEITVTLAGGETLEREVPVETWLSGARTATVTVPAGSQVTRVEIDAARAFPDLDRENNVWAAGG
ncbi:MAG: M1 family metallopeptidase [Gemmatimonadota bacterium]